MAAETGTPTAGVSDGDESAARRFSFFQLVSLLERGAPRAARLGGAGPAAREAVRLRPRLTLESPVSEVASVGREEDELGRPRFVVETSFLGLYGPNSPLPVHVTEDLLSDEAEGNDSLVRGFLDLFNHRLLSLFYRAFARHRPHAAHRPDGADPATRRLLLLAGLVEEDRAERLPRLLLLRYAGLLARRARPAAAIERAVDDFFPGANARVSSCVRRFAAVPPASRARLGLGAATLGADAVAGERIEDWTGRYRVTLGPLGREAFERFLPEGADASALAQLCDCLSGGLFEREVELVLRREEIPAPVLGGDARLGLTSWLGRPAEDGRVVFVG